MKTHEEQGVLSNMQKITRLREMMIESGITVKGISEANNALNINTLRRIFQGDERYYTSDDFPQRLFDIENTLVDILRKRADSMEVFAKEIESNRNPLGLE